jgi:hypothetical protein
VCGFSAILIWTCHCLRVMIRMESLKKIAFNPQYIVMMLNIAATILRLVFFGTVYNGWAPDTMVGGVYVNFFIIVLGQCFMVSKKLLVLRLGYRTLSFIANSLPAHLLV